MLAAVLYDALFSVSSLFLRSEYSTHDLIVYFGGGAMEFFLISLCLSVLLDARLRRKSSVSFGFVFSISVLAAAADLSVRLVLLHYTPKLRFTLADFLAGGFAPNAICYAVWSILHICIRSAERAVAQEHKTAALREAMLRYENEALSCALDSGLFIDGLMRIARALSDGSAGLAGEIVTSVAERMRTAVAPPPEESMDEAFAGAIGRAERPEMTDAALRRLFSIGALGVWAAFFCCQFSTEVGDGRLWWKPLSDYGAQSIVGVVWFVVAGRLLQNAAKYRIRVLCAIVAATCVLGVCACGVALYASFLLRRDLAWPPLVGWIFGFEFNFVAPIFVGWGAVYLLIDARRREIARLNAAAEIQEAALKARNAVLRLQVSPHFLFNALNALYALILDRQFEQARGMISAVRRFVDRAGDPASGELVELSNELATQDAYLEIERVRFGDRLRVARRIDAEAAGAKVPHLILQPLVENAVKYAVARTDRPVAIEIRARRAGHELVLEVADTGAPEAASRPPGLGMGLRNVEARLKSLYGGAGRLACRPLEPSGFLAEVWLPFSL